MNNKPASIFLHHVTLIDAAYIDRKGRPRGVTFDPVFVVSGSTDNVEEVVVDFSKCKKLIKELIDHKEMGFDHKLWVDPQHEAVKACVDHAPATTYIETNSLSLEVPSNAVRVIPGMLGDPHYVRKGVEAALSEYLNAELAGHLLTVQVSVPAPRPVCTTTLARMLGISEGMTSTEVFEYTHGLPDSSSWGCQNILHGHTSFLTLGGGWVSERRALVSKMADYLGDAYLYNANADHGLLGDDRNVLSYRYETGRGKFQLQLNTKDVPVVGMAEGAVTIENIVAHLATKFAAELNRVGVTHLFVSEGLWKGSCIQRKDWTDNG